MILYHKAGALKSLPEILVSPEVRDLSNTTVSLTSIDHVAAWASNELFHDGASQ
jgi:hypothetical protein